MTFRNLFACLVHERPESVADLVRNLRHFDPGSAILLYDGGSDPGLLAGGFPFERWGATVHPAPRPQAWGRLHEFALESMRFALEHLPFDALTIVDSDQLLAHPGYSERLAAVLAGRPGAGLLGSALGPQPRGTCAGPAAAALREFELWRPWLRRFRDGEELFPHWTFWPATVFTAAAARDLLSTFDSDAELRGILGRSRIWATEEVVLPTLVALLGHEVALRPGSPEYVRFRQPLSRGEVEQALADPEVFWVHPVARPYDDPVRAQIRERSRHYPPRAPVAAPPAREAVPPPAAPEPPRSSRSGLPVLPVLPILERMRRVEGWFDDEEGDLLAATAVRALADLPEAAVVELGSYCGRSTVVLASVVQALRPGARVAAIDPHLGEVGALDRGLETREPTLERMRQSLAEAGVAEAVEVVRKRSFEVVWEGPIGLLLIDGLHDYANVARDFHHFAAAVLPGGYVAFHDYAPYYPGVRAFADELLAGGGWQRVGLAKSLLVVRKLAPAEPARELAPSTSHFAPAPALPLVSCILPTRDRRAFVPRALRLFLAQDYPAAELIVVDDGEDRVADLMPDDPRVRYLGVPGPLSIGAKRNLACAEAKGEIILHWDDDDWMAPRRIRTQVEALLAAEAAGFDICGLPRLWYHEPEAGRAWEYAYPKRDRIWLAGATLCYRRELWRRGPFPDTSVGEDTRFLWADPPKRLLPLDDPTLYVATLHPGNTSAPKPGGPGWRRLPGEEVRKLIGEERSPGGA